MSVSNILIQTGANAGKIKPELIVGGGAGVVDSVNATAGIHIDNADVANPIVQIGTGQAGDLIVGTATQYVGAVLQQGANGTYLGVDNAGVLGYSVPPTQGIPFTAGGQMLYAGGAPAFADTLLNLGNPGQVLGVAGGVPTWTDTGGSGLISANLPLIEEADPAPNSKISINFSANVGEIPYGTGVAKTGALTVAPNPASSNQFLGTVAGVPTWKNVGGSSISGIAPIVEIVGAGDESQIAIGFQSAGQIPYGTAVNTGTLTNAPVAGQILGMAGTPPVPTWVNAGGSGTITGTFPIVETAGGTNESIISIGFADKGDMAVGSGVSAGAGLILPTPKDGAGNPVDDYVLSSFSSAPQGMRWVPPTSSSTQSIIRSTTALTAVPDPQTIKDTLILVAEDPDGSWDARGNPADPNDKDPYNLDATTEFVLVNGINCSLVAYVVYVNTQRCIDLHILTNTDDIPVGLLYQNAYTTPSCVVGVSLPLPTGLGQLTVFERSFIVYGSFANFHQYGQNPPPDIEIFSACLVDCDGVGAGNIVVLPINNFGVPGSDYRGFVNNSGNNQDPVVYKVLWNQATATMMYFGYFTGFQNGSGASSTTIDGYNSIVIQNTTVGGFGTAVEMSQGGLGVSLDGASPVSLPGFVRDAYLSTDATQLYIVGAWDWFQQTNGTWLSAVNKGFGYYNATLGGNDRWANTPNTINIPDGMCIRPSFTQANNLILVNKTILLPPIFYDMTANTLTATTGAIPAGTYAPYENSITGSASIDIGLGATAYDFILYQDTQGGTMEVIWFSTPTALVAQPLTPSPTGLKPLYLPTTFPPTYTGPYLGLPFYGIKAEPAFLELMATSARYKYDPASHAQLDFTGNFFYNGVAKTTARFSTANQGNESQAFVASTSLKAWIQTGAKTDGLTYLP